MFLLVATYHFGKEDSLDENNQSFFKFLILGLPIILAPLSFHFEETLNIFKILYIQNDNLIGSFYFFEKKNIFIILLATSFVIGGLFSRGDWPVFVMEKISIILLNISCNPPPPPGPPPP